MARTIYCPECGDPSPIGQKFCEKCGTALPQPENFGNSLDNSRSKSINISPPSQTASQAPIYQEGGGLFNPSRMNYVVKEEFWDWGSGPIYDAHGTQIGKMKRKVFSIRERIEFREMNNQLVGSIHRKILSWKPTYILLNPQEQEIARLEKKLFTMFHPKFFLKDPQGNILLTAIGKFAGFDFKIYRGMNEDTQNLVAEIHKANRWRDIFFNGMWDYKDTYGVQIKDRTVDRRHVLGFVIAIDNVMHDQ
jgi:uncharacterized protein YxjI